MPKYVNNLIEQNRETRRKFSRIIESQPDTKPRDEEKRLLVVGAQIIAIRKKADYYKFVRISPELGSCALIKDPWRRKLAVASIVSKVFIDNGLAPPVVVGGTAVQTYSGGEYFSTNTELLSGFQERYDIMEGLDYSRDDRGFHRRDLDSFIEFQSGEFSGTKDRVVSYLVEETNLQVYLTSLEDIILDRVEAYSFSSCNKSKEWAMSLMGSYCEVLDWSYLHKRAHEKCMLDKLEELQSAVKLILRRMELL